MKKAACISILIIGSMSQGVNGQDQAAANSISEITVSYRTRNNLLVIPFMINESLKVNLLLDPHCKTVILFGKRYKKILRSKRGNDVRYATSAVVDNTSGPVSYDNKISLGPASADNIPIVVVPNTSIFNFFTSVNGVIGSDFLSDYELIIHERTQTVTIRPMRNKQLSFTTSQGLGYRFQGKNISN
jgi:hypothetical protein